VEHQLKSISKAGIPEALAKVELLPLSQRSPRKLNPFDGIFSRSIPSISSLVRMLGLPPSRPIYRRTSDRYLEVQAIFQGLRDPYEKLYYMGLLHERHAKTQLLVGYAPHSPPCLLVEEAMHCFSEAEKIRRGW